MAHLILKPIRLFALPVFFLLISCNSSFTPKPPGYFKISFPQKKYTVFNESTYPYSFEYPVYARVTKRQQLLWRCAGKSMVDKCRVPAVFRENLYKL